MRLPVHIWIREENATPEELAGYFTELARRLDAHPQKMRLMIESSVPAILDFDPADGEPVVSIGGRSQKFSLRHRWLPEHPVPLALGPVPISVSGSVPMFFNATAGSVPVPAGSVPNATEGSVPKVKKCFSGFIGRIFKKDCIVLLIDPIDGNRFRVRSRHVVRLPRSFYALFAVFAVSAVVTLHPLALTLAALLLIGLIVASLKS